MRLRARLALGIGAVGLITVSSVAIAAWALSAGEVRDSVDTELRQRIAPFQAIVERIEAGEVRPPDADATEGDDTVESGRPVDADGRPVLPPGFGRGELLAATTPDQSTAEDLIDAGAPVSFQFVFADDTLAGTPIGEPTDDALASLDTDEIHFESVVVGGTDYRVATLPLDFSDVSAAAEFVDVENPVVAMQVYRDVSNEEGALSSLAVRLGVLSLLGVAMVAIVSWVTGRWMARPALDLAERAEHLAELDDLPSRVEIGRTDEFGRLAGSFNRMLSALEVGREQQQRLVADASHELRTPLTSLRMRLEYLRKHSADDEESAMLDGAVSDAEQLSSLVADLVDLAADVRSAEEDPVALRVGGLVEEVAARARSSSGREIDVVVDDTVAELRPTMVRRAIRNLVDNALKYAPEGALRIVAERGRIEVHDAGTGIAEEDRAFAFDRFYRSPKARARSGNGIGLAIVQQVADAHAGDTWIGTSPLGGACVGFSVSVADPAPASLQGVFRSDSAPSHATSAS